MVSGQLPEVSERERARSAATDDREPNENRRRLRPRRRRPLQPDRPRRRPQLQLLRQHHDQKRQLLPMRQLREYERVLVGGETRAGAPAPHVEGCFSGVGEWNSGSLAVLAMWKSLRPALPFENANACGSSTAKDTGGNSKGLQRLNFVMVR